MTTVFRRIPYRLLQTGPAGVPLSIAHVSKVGCRSLKAATMRPMATGGSLPSGGNGLADHSPQLHHTVTALSRWSVANRQLPREKKIFMPYVLEANECNAVIGKIKALHVYDFDNTRQFSMKCIQSCY
jgi:hypothetical protein